MSSATINRWCYAFDDDRSPPVTRNAPKPTGDGPDVAPAPEKRHCRYCHTLTRGGNGTSVCDDEKCYKRWARDKETKRLDEALSRSGGGLVQQGQSKRH